MWTPQRRLTNWYWVACARQTDIGHPGRATNAIYNCHLSPFHKSIALFEVRPSQYVPIILRCHLLAQRPSVSISAPPFIYSQGDSLFDPPVGAPGRGRVVEAHGRSLTLEIQLHGHPPKLAQSFTTLPLNEACWELGRVLNDRQFTDIYVGTLICPRCRILVSQIQFFNFWRRARIRAFTDFLWSIFTGQFWQTVFVSTQLLNKLS